MQSGDYKYEGEAPGPIQIVVEDGRKDGLPFAPAKIGISKLKVQLTPSDMDPLDYLGRSLAAELTKHGIAASTKPTEGAEVIKVRVEAFNIDVRFATGFGPTTTLTRLRTVVSYEGKSQIVSDAIVRSNVLKSSPKKDKKGTWAYVFEDAIHTVIRGAAAKLNRHFWGLSVPGAKVDQMIAAVPASPDKRELTKLVDLACTNNERAAKYLRVQAQHDVQSQRRTALWALGVIGSDTDVPALEKTAMEGGDGRLLMGIKSLEDIGTPKAQAAIKTVEAAKRPTLSGRGLAWLDAILNLY